MWLKLRAGFRDARRRHQKCFKSGTSPQHIKPWKYESQMSFLQSFMSSGPREGNLGHGSDDESQFPSQPLTNEYWEGQNEESSQLDPGENVYEGNTEVEQPLINDEGNTEVEQPPINSEKHDDGGNRKQTGSLTQNSTLLIPQKKRKPNNDLRTILERSIKHRDERTRQRDEERAKLVAETKNTDDPMFNFFMSMYQLTQAMPHHYQHRVRAQVFQTVSDAEAEIMNIRPSSVTSQGSTASSITTHSSYTTLHPLPLNSPYTYPMPGIHHAHQTEQDPTNLLNVSNEPNSLNRFQYDDGR